MTDADELDNSGSNAPLLAPAYTPDHDHEDHGNEGLASELEYSGGWFIWALTFSAGISGLLFGYEYAPYSGRRLVAAPLFYRIAANSCLNFQHRSHFLNFGDSWHGSLEPTIDNTRQKPGHVMYEPVRINSQSFHRSAGR
jgi:hypothetical protein